jgi:hypothetical protein
MGYKILGFVVWRAGNWYVRRRLSGSSRKLAIAALGGALVAGAVVAQRRTASD